LEELWVLFSSTVKKTSTKKIPTSQDNRGTLKENSPARFFHIRHPKAIPGIKRTICAIQPSFMTRDKKAASVFMIQIPVNMIRGPEAFSCSSLHRMYRTRISMLFQPYR
jgi:hypothetical protein